METELAHLHGGRSRRSFALGCAIAVTRMRAQAALTERERGGRALRAATLGGVAVALALVVYGLHHYPGLAAGPAAWAAIITFLLVLCAYAFSALTLARGRMPEMARARRSGLLGGLVIGAAWLVVLAPGDLLKTLVALPLAVALLGPAVLAGIVGRTTRSARVATHAAAWSGLVGGLLVFVVWVVAAYRGAGGPYDPSCCATSTRAAPTTSRPTPSATISAPGFRCSCWFRPSPTPSGRSAPASPRGPTPSCRASRGCERG
jgi:hypothetical protein